MPCRFTILIFVYICVSVHIFPMCDYIDKWMSYINMFPVEMSTSINVPDCIEEIVITS